MAYICEICNKKTVVGRSQKHKRGVAGKRWKKRVKATFRLFRPNLQRVTLKIERGIDYDEKLCQRVNDDSIKIWNSDWLNDDINDIINETALIDEDVIEEIDKVIDPDEIQLFEY